jgi:hypothetical protein
MNRCLLVGVTGLSALTAADIPSAMVCKIRRNPRVAEAEPRLIPARYPLPNVRYWVVRRRSPQSLSCA